MERFPDGNYPEAESIEELIARAGDAFEKIVISYRDKKLYTGFCLRMA